MKTKQHIQYGLAGMAVAQFAPMVHAAPIDDELGSNAAVLLVLLGVWALLMGVRNLRDLQHRRLIPERQLSLARRENEHVDVVDR